MILHRPVDLVEITFDEVVGFNRKAITNARQRDLACKEIHSISPSGENKLRSALGSIFYRDYQGIYLNLPIEKVAALLLHRIAEGQCFENGNKRTALLSCYFFLWNNGYRLEIDQGRVNDLLWGFAKDENDPTKPPRFDEQDAQQYIERHLMFRS